MSANYALVDEVDSILIDFLIQQCSWNQSALLCKNLLDKDDYIIDAQSKTIGLSRFSIDKAESYSSSLSLV